MRKSTRKFLDKKVPQKYVDTIIEAGRLAPSTKNVQPWLFVQVNNEQKNAVAEELIKTAKSADFPMQRFMLATADAICQAPILILVFATTIEEYYYNSYILSIGAAIENCILQATELGIKSLWNCDITAINQKFFKKLLNLDYKIIAGISLGYSSEEESKKKKHLNEVFIINE